MIIVKLTGGLGNQLFQYATGKALAIKNNTIIKFEVSDYTKTNLRQLDLENFNLEISKATEQEIQMLFPKNAVEKFLQYFKPFNKRNYFREKYFHFDKTVLILGSNLYIKGFFQSEKYFKSIRDLLIKTVLPKTNFNQNINSVQNRINNSNSVSVHIRRGDFANNSMSNSYHGTLSIEHYINAIELINTKTNNPTFYFFSDDINWVKENLKIPYAIYVSEEITKNQIEDLYLMSCCQHNIIANSSFSWWGAWLNKNPNKIVIAPKKWFNNGPKDTQDLIPETWITI